MEHTKSGDNRLLCPSYIPTANDQRVILSPENGQSDYICASYVDVSPHTITIEIVFREAANSDDTLWASDMLAEYFLLTLNSVFWQGYRQRNAFIITQGPMKNTVGDFWKMMWEQKSTAIVMLTQLQEDGEVSGCTTITSL